MCTMEQRRRRHATAASCAEHCACAFTDTSFVCFETSLFFTDRKNKRRKLLKDEAVHGYGAGGVTCLVEEEEQAHEQGGAEEAFRTMFVDGGKK